MALTEFTREYGVRSSDVSSCYPCAPAPSAGGDDLLFERPGRHETGAKPGQCTPWKVKRGERPEIPGDGGLARRVWEDVDALGHTFIWQCLVPF